MELAWAETKTKPEINFNPRLLTLSVNDNILPKISTGNKCFRTEHDKIGSKFDKW